mgnify:CR=1 FL=1
MNSIVKIDAMMRQAEYDYAKIVSGIQEKKQRNELIERTKNYIFQNLHSEIIISKIAYEIGVNASYLSDLFHRVEGLQYRSIYSGKRCIWQKICYDIQTMQ